MVDDKQVADSRLPGAKSGPTSVGGDMRGGLKYRGGGRGVERGEVSGYEAGGEVGGEIELEEILDSPEIEKKPELAGYIEEVERAAELSSAVVDDYTGQVLLNPAKQKKEVVLPLSEEQIQEGLRHKVWEGVRWLAEWCVRQVKLWQGRVKYRS